MTSKTLFAAAAVAALFGGSAWAQTPASSIITPPATEPTPVTPSAPPGSSAAELTPAQKRSVQEMSDETRSAGSEDLARTPAATDFISDVASNQPAPAPRVVTNGPVPDTAENRARYGSPLSRAGKRTAPAGN